MCAATEPSISQPAPFLPEWKRGVRASTLGAVLGLVLVLLGRRS